MTNGPLPRAAVFVDGANVFRRYKAALGIDANTLDLRKVAKSLAGPSRQVVEVRYYTGKAHGGGDRAILAQQQALFSTLQKHGVIIRLGRLEERTKKNDLSAELLRYLATPQPPADRLPPVVYRAIHAMAQRHSEVSYWVQKAVDTLLVAELAGMAAKNQYDVAYVLSNDGDMTPGIELARSFGKTVFGAGPAGAPNYQIRQACNDYIVLDAARLATCLQ